jgi:hypothetical protein
MPVFACRFAADRGAPCPADPGIGGASGYLPAIYDFWKCKLTTTLAQSSTWIAVACIT